MSKSEINALIGILENRMNSVTETMTRFVLFQEIKSLQLKLDSLADIAPAFYVYN